MASADGSIIIDITADPKKALGGLKAIQNRLDGMASAAKKLTGIIAGAFATHKIVQFGKEAIQLGSDVAEVQNVVDVAFGEMSYKVEEFASSAIQNFGMRTLAAKKTASTYMAMAKNMGLSMDAASDMAITLTGLTGDVASFYNISQDLADIKLKSVFTGETETLKDLGIVMTQANLEAYALNQGITRSIKSMSQAELVTLRYNFVLDQLAMASGDFVRTQDSWANQTRILSMQWQEFMSIIGQALTQILLPVVKVLNKVVSSLITMANAFKAAVSSMFGGTNNTQLKQEQEAVGGVSSEIGSAVENQEDLTDATAQTNKEQKKSLAAFDEINRLAGDTASISGSGSGAGIDTGVGGGTFVEVPAPDTEGVQMAFDSWGEALDTFVTYLIEQGIPKLKAAFTGFATWLNGFSAKLYEAFTFPGLAEKFGILGAELADAFNGLVSAIDWYTLGAALGAGFNLALQFLVNLIYTFDWVGFGASLAAAVNGAVSQIDWYAVGQMLWAGFKWALETLAGFLLGLDMAQLGQAASNIAIGFFNSITETLRTIDWSQIGAQIAEFMNNIDWAGVIAAIAETLGALIPSLLELLGGFIANADPSTIVASIMILVGLIGLQLLPLITAAIGSFITGKISLAVTSGLNGLLGAISPAINSIKQLLASIFSGASPLAGAAALFGGIALAAGNFFDMLNNGFSWLNETLMIVGTGLAAIGAIILGAPAAVAGVVAGIVAAVATLVVLIAQHWEEIKAGFIAVWDSIKAVFATVAEWVNTNVIQPVAEFFTGLWNTIKTLASDAWAGIQEIWGAVSAWFNETVIQPVGEFFSGLWDGIRQTASDVWNAIVEVWQAAGSWFEEHVTGPIGKAFEAVGDFVKGVFNKIIGFIEGLINKVIDGINWLIDQLNKISFEVPDWVPDIGGKSFGFNISHVSEVKLPRLATGAVVPPNREFLAMLGDNKKETEIVSPLSTMKQALMEALQESGAAGGGDVTIVVNLDGREVARNTVRHINQMTRSGGRSPLLV